MGDAPLADDVTLVVVSRNSSLRALSVVG